MPGMTPRHFVLWLFTAGRLRFCGGVELCTERAGFQPQCKFLLPEPVETGGIAAGF